MGPTGIFILLVGVALWYAIYAWTSYLNGQDGSPQWMFWVTWAVGALCPGWAIMSRYAKDMWQAAIWYDMAMAAGFFGGMYILGYAEGLSVVQKIATLMIVVGIILLHWK